MDFLYRFFTTLKFASFFLILTSSSIWAGAYTLTTSNFDTTNGTNAWCVDCLDLGSNVQSDSSTGFSLTDTALVESNGENTLTLQNVKIRRGQTWKKINLTYSGSGDITVLVKNSSGDVLNGSGGDTASGGAGSASFDISDVNNKTGASDINIELSLSSDAALQQVQITYSSNTLVVFPSPFTPSQSNATIKIDMEDSGVVTLKIFDSRARLVKTIFNSKSVSGFDTPNEGIKVSWNGKNSNGTLVPSGIYIALATVTSGGNTESLRFKFLVIR